MTVHYSLYRNHLKTGEEEYAARTMSLGTIGLEEIAEAIVSLGTTVTKTDVLAVLEGMCQVSEAKLVEGFRVQLGGVAELFTRIKGIFTGPNDGFDPSRHKIDVGANPGTRVRRAIETLAVVEKDETILPKPSPMSYTDFETGETGGEVSSNYLGTIEGLRLKVNEDNPDEGVYFINTSTSAETKVAKYDTNLPKQLKFKNPALDDGTYWLEVRRRFTEEGVLRVGRLDGTLAVGPPPPAKGNGSKKKKRALARA